MSRGEMTIAEKKELAKVFIVNQKLSQKEAAAKVKVTEKTMSKWVTDGKWRELQQSLLLTREAQLNLMVQELAKINEEVAQNESGYADKTQAYIRDTLVQNIKKLQIETGAEAVIETAERFCRFMRKINLEKALEINNYFDTFIREEVLK